jgi:ATP-dependent helicase HrpB
LLPIKEIFSALAQQLKHGNAIVIAPPGAGKSTALPLFLLQQATFQNTKILMLQPRRIAARNIAHYLSKQLGEKVGGTVGYRVRGENQTSSQTRLEIVTEGILTRMVQSSPELPGVGLIIFDEFHERSVHADFSLALSIEVQQALREDIRLLVMSATLNAEPISEILPNAKLLESKGKTFPIDIQYVAENSRLSIVEQVCRLILSKFHEHEKDFLVFLPGAFEIRKAADTLTTKLADVVVLPLFSDLKKQLQQDALMPNKEGKRKIVLATNIAETSLTIEGIEVVVDSGVEKKAIFDLRRGITHLTSQKISQASATQRAGRAGRLMPGTCYRLWSKEQHGRLTKQSPPEILQTDISDFVLEAAIWGTQVSELALIDYPIPAQLSQAQDKLESLAVITNTQIVCTENVKTGTDQKKVKVTAFGRQVHALGGNANIAIMLLKSKSLSAEHQSLACAIAALLESKDPLPQGNTVEVVPRLGFLLNNRHHSIWTVIKQWHRKFNAKLLDWPLHDVGILLAFGFPQWLAKPRGSGRFILANGSGATLHIEDDLLRHLGDQNSSSKKYRWVAIGNMQLTDKQTDSAIIRYAESISTEALEMHFSTFFEEKESVFWDEDKQRVSAALTRFFGKIQINKTPLPSPSKFSLIQIWREVLKQKGLKSIPFDLRTVQLLKRVNLARTISKVSEFPDLSEAALLKSMDDWLLPYLTDKNTWEALCGLPFYQLLSQKLDYKQLKKLNELLPESIVIPIGRSAGINYNDGGKAVLSVRMQELYGLKQHPTLLNGNLPITCELLSPAQRPIQTTEDIVSFWSGSYKQVQKEMKGKYPRHFWPDDPANAPATSTTKKRMQQ